MCEWDSLRQPVSTNTQAGVCFMDCGAPCKLIWGMLYISQSGEGHDPLLLSFLSWCTLHICLCLAWVWSRHITLKQNKPILSVGPFILGGKWKPTLLSVPFQKEWQRFLTSLQLKVGIKKEAGVSGICLKEMPMLCPSVNRLPQRPPILQLLLSGVSQTPPVCSRGSFIQILGGKQRLISCKELAFKLCGSLSSLRWLLCCKYVPMVPSGFPLLEQFRLQAFIPAT